jgi:hypothetical protein
MVDPARMRRAVAESLEAMQPIIVAHGATLALPAIASAMGLLLVGCHRMGATGCPLAEATGLLSRRFGEAVGQALAGAAELDGERGGRA